MTPESLPRTYPNPRWRTNSSRTKLTLVQTRPCGFIGGGNSITSPRTSSYHLLAFSGRWTKSANSSAVIGLAAAATVLMPFSLRPEPAAGQRQRPVDHHRLAQRRRHDVVAVGE